MNEIIDEGIMSRSSYIHYQRIGRLDIVRKPARGNPALIDVDSLPDAAMDCLKRKCGVDFKKEFYDNPLADKIEKDTAAEDYFFSYRKEDGSKLSAEKVKEYSANAAVLNAIVKILNENKAYGKTLGGNGKKEGVYRTILKGLPTLKSEWGFNLLGSERNLRAKINKYKAEGYAGMIHGNDGNNYAAKVKYTEQQALLRTLMRKHNNFNDVQIATMYNEVAKYNGWRGITDKTVGKRRVEWKLFTESARRGTQQFDNKFTMQHKRSAPIYPMLYWTLDGWDVELLYQKTTTNKDGNKVTTYHNRLTMVIVLDPCTKYPVGYAIGIAENSELIKKAVRNALKHTEKLFGIMHRPQQVQSDRFGISLIGSFMEQITPKFTPARAKNAKAKIIEPYFKYLNQNYCQFERNWSGFGVKAKGDNQPNSEAINAHRHQFPDMAGCAMQIVNMIEKEREKKCTEYLENWQALPEDYKLPWTTEQYLHYAGETTGYTNKLTGDGLNIKIAGKQLTYDSFDYNFRRFTHIDWIVKYDTADLSTVLATNADGSLRFLLEEKYVQPMALIDRKENDGEQLARVNRFSKQLKEMIIDQTAEDWRIVDAMFAANPQLNDTVAKMQIVDSEGQHKIYKKSEAVQVAERIATTAFRNEKKQEAKVQKALAQGLESKREEYLNNKIDISKYL